MTARQGALPPGWARATIEDLFAPLSDGRTMHQGWSPQCHDEPARLGEWGVLKTTAIQAGAFIDEHNKRLPAPLEPRPGIEVGAGDILLTSAGPRSRCGVPCLVRHTRSRLMMSGKMYRFRVPVGVNPIYIESWLLTAEAQAAIDRMKTGGSDSGLNLTHDRFRTLEVVVAPSKEQDRIVEALESYLPRLDAALASLERVQARIQACRSSIVRAAVEGRLVPTEAEMALKEKQEYEPASALLDRILNERRRRWEQAELARLKTARKTPKGEEWKAKHIEPQVLDKSKLPSLPEGWCWASLAQLLAEPLANGKSVPDGDGMPVLRLSAIRNRSVDLAERKRGSWGKLDPATFVVRSDDLLIVRGNGTLNLVGRCGRVGRVSEAVAFPDTLIRARVVGVRPDLFAHLWDSFSVRQHLEKRAKTTAGIYKINQTDLEQTPIPLAPSTEQTRLSERMELLSSELDASYALLQRTVARLTRLRQSILKWAFEGKLVDQDPSDEPAERLLARIRAQRATSTTTTNKPKNCKERLAG